MARGMGSKSASVLVMLAGLASGGCFGDSARSGGPALAADQQPSSDQPASTQPVRGTAGEGGVVAVVHTTQTPSPAREIDAQSAWGLNSNAQVVEEARRAEPEPQSNEQSGPNLASRLYGEMLSLELPGEPSPGEQGVQTNNIRQASFNTEGSDFDPAVSRDGRLVVFSSTQHRPTADIYIKPIDSRVVTRLTSDPAQDAMPAISPDGSRIAFASNRSGSWDIYVMSSTGGKALQITSDGTHELHPSWSPDGSRLVFCKLGQTTGRWELWIVDVDNPLAANFIGYGLFPEWSPVPRTGMTGGDRIVFQRSRERGERSFSVWTLDYDPARNEAGNETEIVASPNAAFINPGWSPDGTRVVYSAVPNDSAWTEGSDRPAHAGLWMIGIDGRGEVSLTRGDSVDLMPAWASNGRVLFVSDRGGVENLWSLDIAPAIYAATGVDPRAEPESTFATAPTDDD